MNTCNDCLSCKTKMKDWSYCENPTGERFKDRKKLTSWISRTNPACENFQCIEQNMHSDAAFAAVKPADTVLDQSPVKPAGSQAAPVM